MEKTAYDAIANGPWHFNCFYPSRQVMFQLINWQFSCFPHILFQLTFQLHSLRTHELTFQLLSAFRHVKWHINRFLLSTDSSTTLISNFISAAVCAYMSTDTSNANTSAIFSAYSSTDIFNWLRVHSTKVPMVFKSLIVEIFIHSALWHHERVHLFGRTLYHQSDRIRLPCYSEGKAGQRIKFNL